MKMIDLSDRMAEDAPVWFTLTDAETGAELSDADGKPVRIRLHGPDSEVMVAFERHQQQTRLTAAAKTGRVNLNAEELDNETTARAATALAESEGLLFNGQPVSAENALTVLGNRRLRWLRDWVIDKLANRGNFLGGVGALDDEVKAAIRAAVRPIFDLGQVWNASGKTLYDQLSNAAEQTGDLPERLTPPPVPHAFERVMLVWQQMHKHRTPSAAGLSGLVWADFAGYQTAMRDWLTPLEIEAIGAIDEYYFEARTAAAEHRNAHADRTGSRG